jgi:hypothetical protein
LLGQAASTITGSPVFKKVLEVLLIFGNFLNQGSFRGNAQGVKINFLSELKSTKVSAMTTTSCAEGPDEGVRRRGGGVTAMPLRQLSTPLGAGGGRLPCAYILIRTEDKRNRNVGESQSLLRILSRWIFCGQAHHHASISSYNMLHYLNEYLGPKNPEAPRTKPDDGVRRISMKL